MNYREFLEGKLQRKSPHGMEPRGEMPGLFAWQRALSGWALRTGQAALFEDCGLGKTRQQLAWGQEVAQQTHRPVLILAPLAVSRQTQREGEAIGVPVQVCEMQTDVKSGVNITNYEKLSHFDARAFSGVVLDESSILKSYMGKTKRAIVDAFCDTPYRLACTATPAPNDLMELLNHAEFLGVMRSSEALSIWFIADQKNSGTYRLKGHAAADFWQWVASWAVCIEKPSDIGYSDEGYRLPKLTETDEVIPISELADDFTGGFLREVDMSATGFYREKSRTVEARAERCAQLVDDAQQHLVWCETNEEATALRMRIPNAVEIRGSDAAEKKERAALDFVDGKTRVLISKPSIFGYGLNFQNCADAVFCGLNYSFESYYQAVRRLYRFGQTRPVTIRRVLGSTEKNILDVLQKKQEARTQMQQSMACFMREFQKASVHGRRYHLDLERQVPHVPAWLKTEEIA